MPDNENNVRTLDFGGDTPQVMPEDVFEGGVPDGIDIEAAVPQFADEGTIVVGDFSQPDTAPVLTAVSLHTSQPFFYIEIPSLGIEAPVDVDTALSLFDSLGAAINEL